MTVTMTMTTSAMAGIGNVDAANDDEDEQGDAAT